jgi:RNA polymerase-binding transcription factor DksA
MDAISLRKYQEKLRSRKKQVLSTLSHLEEEDRAVTGQRHFDWLDQARDESDSQLLQRLSDGYLYELARLDTALGRILAGTYGLCLACHHPIENGRLDIFPETEFCADCQDMRERVERA